PSLFHLCDHFFGFRSLRVHHFLQRVHRSSKSRCAFSRVSFKFFSGSSLRFCECPQSKHSAKNQQNEKRESYPITHFKSSLNSHRSFQQFPNAVKIFLRIDTDRFSDPFDHPDLRPIFHCPKLFEHFIFLQPRFRHLREFQKILAPI